MVCAGNVRPVGLTATTATATPRGSGVKLCLGFLICHGFFPGRRPHNCSRIRKSCPRINRMMSSEGISTGSGERRRDGPPVRARWELAEQAQPYVMHVCMRWTLDTGCWTLDAPMQDAGMLPLQARGFLHAISLAQTWSREKTRLGWWSCLLLAAGSRAELSHPSCRITFRRAAKLIGVASIGLQLALFIGQSSEKIRCTQQTGLVIPGPGRKNTRFQNRTISKLSLIISCYILLLLKCGGFPNER
ncbi:hypothetical protein B0T24DRAFT_212679 [Lasiosphaeria ovina]|uniref:Uncharacterized protein n=1 Tax=Lasiosphaeria ovina TaxID=92902 RepID=A0AAE0KH11_9PEZI|nr:hypothetical protein B0T24DRAFT_212679 [Lasiosphaeria ovina]